METKVTAYIVKGCKVSYNKIWSGYVLNINNEPITESIKRKLGVKNLHCENVNEGFEFDRVDIYSIPITELTLGDLMLMTGGLRS